MILLDEVYGTVTREELGRFFELPALARLGEWRFVLGRSGGRQKAVIATRQLIRPEAGLIAVHYRPGTLEALAERFPTPPVEQLLAAEHQRGLATAGAWVTLGQREVLFVPLDLQAAGYDGSAEDVLRELQAARLVEAISAVLGEEAPLIVGGDLNLVGARTPLDILRDGLGLEAVEAYRLTDRSQATWRSSGGGAFTPGRLDFVLPSVAHFEVSSSFIFDTAELADEQLRELGLTRTDSAEASNHLLTVADLRPR